MRSSNDSDDDNGSGLDENNATTTMTGNTSSRSAERGGGGGGADNAMTFTTQVVFVVLYSMVVILSVGGNGLVIFSIVTCRRMRTVTNYFIVNLASADLLMAVSDNRSNSTAGAVQVEENLQEQLSDRLHVRKTKMLLKHREFKVI